MDVSKYQHMKHEIPVDKFTENSLYVATKHFKFSGSENKLI